MTRRGWTGRSLLGLAVVGSILLAPQAAVAQTTTEPAAGALVEAEVETTVTVAVPVVADRSIYLLGERAPVSATVRASAAAPGETPEPPRGTVEFLDGETSLGSTEVVADGASGRAAIETDRWEGSGAREVTAVFTPAPGSGFAPATSAPRTYRIVDTERIVPDVALEGEPAAAVEYAELDWTIANIWFSNFRVGFEREALSGPVTLPDVPHPGSGASDAELQAYFFRPFTFSEGSGARDAAGNRVISFTGAARLTSGSGNLWDFADPKVHIAPNGDGYITAEFSGFSRVGAEEQTYGPVRVTIATFSGAEIVPDGFGRVEASIVLNWAGQANGPGTWFYDYDDAFPGEFVALLNPLVAPFFVRSAVATDDSKIPHPITLRFAEANVPPPEEPEPGAAEAGSDADADADAGADAGASADAGADAGADATGASASAGAGADPSGADANGVTPGSAAHPASSSDVDADRGRLAATGGPARGTAVAIAAVALLGAVAAVTGGVRGARRRG